MNKKEFMSELKKNLKGLSKEDREEIIEDYGEHFDIGKKRKRKESEIAKSLGKPKQLAKQAKVELLVSKAEKKKSVKNISRAIFATIGMSFFNLIFVVGIFFGLLGVLIGLFATGFAIAVSGLSLAVLAFLPISLEFISLPLVNHLTVFFVGLGLLCLGTLFCIGTWYVGKGFYIITIKYIKLNIRIISGERE